jgi:transcriptional regulator with XRE-family HTH domain
LLYTLKTIIGEAIQKVLIKKNVSQRQLANAIGKPATQLNKWLLGKNEIGITNLIEIADVLNISIDELVGRTYLLSGESDTVSGAYRTINELDVKTLQKEMIIIKKEVAALKKAVLVNKG